MVGADPVRAGEYNANSREIPHREAGHAYVIHYPKNVTLFVEVSDTDAIDAKTLVANGFDLYFKADRDRSDALWFATNSGISRLIPTPDVSAPPPVILISTLRVMGAPYPISELEYTRHRGPLSTERERR